MERRLRHSANIEVIMPQALKIRPLKYLLIVTIIFFLVTIYAIYKEEIFTWSCHSENVESSCAIVGLINLEKGHVDTAKEYLNKSCDMKYQIACDKLKDIELKDKNLVK